MSSIIFRRLSYYLSPQFDIYQHLGERLKGKVVLEVGFGTGLGVMQYADDAEAVVAIDIDEAAVDFAARMFPVHKVQWHHNDILNLIVGTFDYVVMIEVLEHVDDYFVALGRVKDALKPGGSALITVPNKERSRYTPDPNGAPEWNPKEFAVLMTAIFDSVVLLDHKLKVVSRQYKFDTPIIAEVYHRGS